MPGAIDRGSFRLGLELGELRGRLAALERERSPATGKLSSGRNVALIAVLITGMGGAGVGGFSLSHAWLKLGEAIGITFDAPGQARPPEQSWSDEREALPLLEQPPRP